jgi:hypothetical protein
MIFFFDKSQKAQTTKAKIDKWYYFLHSTGNKQA